MEVVDVVSRWLHVGTAIILLGGAAFQRFVLMPAAKVLPDAEHEQLRAQVLLRWKRFVHLGIGLLLLSGFYNYLGTRTPADVWKGYHPLIGTKILLALAVFVLASGLVGRSGAFAGLRKNASRTLGWILLLGVVIVAISGYVKVTGGKAVRNAAAAAQRPTRPSETPVDNTSEAAAVTPAQPATAAPAP